VAPQSPQTRHSGWACCSQQPGATQAPAQLREGGRVQAQGSSQQHKHSTVVGRVAHNSRAPHRHLHSQREGRGGGGSSQQSAVSRQQHSAAGSMLTVTTWSAQHSQYSSVQKQSAANSILARYCRRTLTNEAVQQQPLCCQCEAAAANSLLLLLRLLRLLRLRSQRHPKAIISPIKATNQPQKITTII
jgi:hypothetical protein